MPLRAIKVITEPIRAPAFKAGALTRVLSVWTLLALAKRDFEDAALGRDPQPVFGFVGALLPKLLQVHGGKVIAENLAARDPLGPLRLRQSNIANGLLCVFHGHPWFSSVEPPVDSPP